MKGMHVIRERDKARKIVGILLEYYVLHEYQDIKIEISVVDEKTIILIEGIVNPNNVNLDELVDILSHPRVVEYDEYYDELLNSDDKQEIKAVGYLIDDAKVSLDSGLLSIKIERKHL